MHSLHLFSIIFKVLLLRSTFAEVMNICAWTKRMSNGETHYTFLRTDHYRPQQLSPDLRLYHTVWSEDRSLLKCAWIDDTDVMNKYLSLCREKTNALSKSHREHFNVNYLFATNRLCVSMNNKPIATRSKERTRNARSVGYSSARSENAHRRRVKRGFIVPGTLWCGSGNKAPSYGDLGFFSETDSCCREHDQCKDTIQSFRFKFGVFNSNMFTMSHCDCDNRFHRCLRNANDSISDVVGYTFFNLLKLHCFELTLELQCMQRNWFGMCKESATALYAVVQSPTVYETDDPSQNNSICDTTVSTQATRQSATPPTAPQTPSISEAAWATPACKSAPVQTTAPVTALVTAPATTLTTAPMTQQSATPPTPPRRPSITEASSTTSTHESAPAPTSNGALEADISSVSSVATSRNYPESTFLGGHLNRSAFTANTSKPLPCQVYRDLDECRFRIRPQRKRYGLLNPEARTLYHCNCTDRLFERLAKQSEVSDVDTLLLADVSQSCFLLPDCGVGEICKAIVLNPNIPQLKMRPGRDMEEWRPLQAVRLKVRRPNSKRTNRRHRTVRLNKLCNGITRQIVQDYMNPK